MDFHVDRTFEFERTFEPEDVLKFADLTGDRQPRHTEPDDQGQLMVQGLLTASMVTKLGGDLEVLAHTMSFTFLEPVYTGDRIRCEMTVQSREETEDRITLNFSATWKRAEQIVAEGTVDGIVRKSSEK